MNSRSTEAQDGKWQPKARTFGQFREKQNLLGKLDSSAQKTQAELGPVPSGEVDTLVSALGIYFEYGPTQSELILSDAITPSVSVYFYYSLETIASPTADTITPTISLTLTYE